MGTEQNVMVPAGGVYRGQAFRFTAAGEADEPALLAFLNSLFPHAHYDAAWLAHQRRECPAGPRDYTLARAEKNHEVVGIYGLHPVPLHVGALAGLASECCNVGVHPFQWGTGLFEDLSRFALARDAARGRLLAFCSPRRHLAVRAHVKIGWEEKARLRFHVKRASGAATAALPAGVREVARFSGSLPPGQPLAGRADWFVAKDAAYLDWRYAAPCYRKFVGLDGGYLVTKEYLDAGANLRRLHVMELVAAVAAEEEPLWATVDAISAGFDEQHTWAEPGSERAAALERHGYTATSGHCPLLVYAHSAAAAAAVAATTTRHIALGDDEAF